MIQLINGERNVKHQTCQLTNYENCGEKTTATKSSELTFHAVTRNDDRLITNQLTAQITRWWSKRIQNVNEFQNALVQNSKNTQTWAWRTISKYRQNPNI